MDAYSIIVALFSLVPLLVLRLTGKFIYFAVAAIVAVALHGIYLFGSQILYLFFITYVISTIAELLSLKTRVRCFGIQYWYNLKHPFFSSRIFFLGVYPLEISFAWVILTYMSFNLAMVIASVFSLTKLWIILLIPLILVSLDFIIDPVSVKVTKLWKWEKGSFYFGIPYQNFLGWYVVGLASTAIFSFLDAARPITFHPLFILPIFFYATILKRVPLMIQLNRPMGILGSLPAFVWTLVGAISLSILYLNVM